MTRTSLLVAALAGLSALTSCGPATPAPGGPTPPGDDTSSGDDDGASAVMSDGDDEPAEPSGPSGDDVDPAGDDLGSSGAGAPSEAQAILAEHNKYRAKHCAPPLAWSDKLAKVAQKWADSLVQQGCAFEHSRTDYGENLAAGTTGYLPPDEVVGMWYREVKDYDWKSAEFSMEAGHFTQVVWKGTREVGCGKAACNGMDLWVCNYDPAGNVEGYFKQNVLPTSCR